MSRPKYKKLKFGQFDPPKRKKSFFTGIAALVIALGVTYFSLRDTTYDYEGELCVDEVCSQVESDTSLLGRVSITVPQLDGKSTQYISSLRGNPPSLEEIQYLDCAGELLSYVYTKNPNHSMVGPVKECKDTFQKYLQAITQAKGF